MNLTSKKRSVKKTLVLTFISIFMILLTISFLYPLFYLLINALKTRNEYYLNPFGLPKNPTFENFISIIVDVGIGRNIWNSLFIAVVSTVLTVLTSAFASYAFAKLHFKKKGLAYAIILCTMFLPAQVTMIPKYAMFAKFGMIDNVWSVIISLWVAGLPSSILLMRNTFVGISNEVIESAKIDGAGFFTIVLRIVSPMGFAGIAIVIIFQFIAAWNDYLTPLLYLSSPKSTTLMVTISQMVTQYAQHPTMQFAALFISVLPTLILYLCLQKYMLKGATSGSIK